MKPVKVFSVFNPVVIRLLPLTRIGWSFSPRSRISSSRNFFCFSAWAAALLFLILNSSVKDVPSRNASLASFCCERSVAVLSANVPRIVVALTPLSCISPKFRTKVSIPSLLPFSPSKTRINASLALVFIKSENSPRLIPAILA